MFHGLPDSVATPWVSLFDLMSLSKSDHAFLLCSEHLQMFTQSFEIKKGICMQKTFNSSLKLGQKPKPSIRAKYHQLLLQNHNHCSCSLSYQNLLYSSEVSWVCTKAVDVMEMIALPYLGGNMGCLSWSALTIPLWLIRPVSSGTPPWSLLIDRLVVVVVVFIISPATLKGEEMNHSMTSNGIKTIFYVIFYVLA